MAEWLRSGLQIRVRRFDSGSGLHREIFPTDSRKRPAPERGAPEVALRRDQIGAVIQPMALAAPTAAAAMATAIPTRALR